MKKIDIHVHSRLPKIPQYIGRPNVGGSYATPQELRAIYDTINVEKGVLLPSLMPECSHYTTTNEDAYIMASQFPDTLYWFCNIDPRIGSNSPNTDLSYFILYYKELGAKGVGEITANLYFDDPLVLNLFHHCEKCDMPVTFHIGNLGNDYGLVDEPGLPRLEKVLQQFPKLIFLGHSQKFWAEISGDCTEENRSGYPTGKVISGGRVVELMRKYPNLHGDLSAGSGYNAITRDPEFGYWFIEEFQDRLYYGTDICDPRNITSPMLKLSSWLDEAMEKGCISKTAYKKVCRENALRILEK
jgi:predicted TIM-barrel fold metal-dependent hydrolase